MVGCNFIKNKSDNDNKKNFHFFTEVIEKMVPNHPIQRLIFYEIKKKTTGKILHP